MGGSWMESSFSNIEFGKITERANDVWESISQSLYGAPPKSEVQSTLNTMPHETAALAIPSGTEMANANSPLALLHDSTKQSMERSKGFTPNQTTSVDSLGKLSELSRRSDTENDKVTRMVLDGEHPMDNSAMRLLYKFPNLTSLDAKLYGKDSEFKNLTVNRKLESLTIDSFVMGSAALEPISQLPNLKKLDLRETKIGQKNLSKLTSASIEELALTGPIKDENYKHIANLPSLKTLRLEQAQLNPEALQALARSKTLQRLVINSPVDFKSENLSKLQALLPGVKIENTAKR